MSATHIPEWMARSSAAFDEAQGLLRAAATRAMKYDDEPKLASVEIRKPGRLSERVGGRCRRVPGIFNLPHDKNDAKFGAEVDRQVEALRRDLRELDEAIGAGARE